MSREIKFRAWDKAFDKMINFDDTLAKEWILGLTLWGDVIGCDLKALEPKSSHETYIITYPERFELMQYTGLKDKNGQEIYEGDIVRCCGGEYYQGYREFDHTIEIKNIINDCFMLGEHEELRVLGNRWDNPDLLKEVTPC